MQEALQYYPLTVVIIAITCIISYMAFNDRGLLDRLLFHPYTVARDSKEKVRFITNGFVHGDMMHLGLNMYVLYMFGGYVEATFVNSLFGPIIGRAAYLILYFGAVIMASYPSYKKHKDNPNYRALGASGGTSAVLLAYVIFNPWAWLLLMFIIPVPALVAAVGYLWYSSYMDKHGNDNIAHDAHLGGAIFGIFFTLLLIFGLAPDAVPSIISDILAGPTMPNF